MKEFKDLARKTALNIVLNFEKSTLCEDLSNKKKLVLNNIVQFYVPYNFAIHHSFKSNGFRNVLLILEQANLIQEYWEKENNEKLFTPLDKINAKRVLTKEEFLSLEDNYYPEVSVAIDESFKDERKNFKVNQLRIINKEEHDSLDIEFYGSVDHLRLSPRKRINQLNFKCNATLSSFTCYESLRGSDDKNLIGFLDIKAYVGHLRLHETVTKGICQKVDWFSFSAEKLKDFLNIVNEAGSLDIDVAKNNILDLKNGKFHELNLRLYGGVKEVNLDCKKLKNLSVDLYGESILDLKIKSKNKVSSFKLLGLEKNKNIHVCKNLAEHRQDPRYNVILKEDSNLTEL